MLDDGKFPSGPLALDTVLIGFAFPFGGILARVSITDYTGKTIYDVMCRIRHKNMSKYLNEVSVIPVKQMRMTRSFGFVQKDVKRIIEVSYLVY